jgi:hypothetical protein
MHSGEALIEHFAERFDALTVNPSGSMVGPDTVPCDLQVLRLVNLVDERVNLPRVAGDINPRENGAASLTKRIGIWGAA